MVAVITTPHRISDALNYNEQKVQRDSATCIYAGNYLGEAEQMNFYQKLAGFESRNSLNDRASTKTLHVSLNFDPSEILAKDKLIAIAKTYVEKIGFGTQPFLVYQHRDAGHPHIHILTTTIKDDGTRINTHNIGRNQSEKARKEIEQEYKLRKAERHRKFLEATEMAEPTQAEYGKDETRRSINNVVGYIVNSYNFTSLPELNAVLSQYNVIADRGSEGSRTFKKNGLVFRLLDKNGNKIGVPIKASLLTGKPTLSRLEKIFHVNKERREQFKQPLKNVIDAHLKISNSLADFREHLLEKKVFIKLRSNDQGKIYGITYVDNKQKVVFNGSDLGKKYSIQGIQQSIQFPEKYHETKSKQRPKGIPAEKYLKNEKQVHQHQEKSAGNNLASQPQHYNEPIPLHLRRKKRKKKRIIL